MNLCLPGATGVLVVPSAGAKRSPAEPIRPVPLVEVLEVLRADTATGAERAQCWPLVVLALRAGGSWSQIGAASGLDAAEARDGFRGYLGNITNWLDCWPGRAFDGLTLDDVIELYRLAKEAAL